MGFSSHLWFLDVFRTLPIDSLWFRLWDGWTILFVTLYIVVETNISICVQNKWTLPAPHLVSDLNITGITSPLKMYPLMPKIIFLNGFLGFGWNKLIFKQKPKFQPSAKHQIHMIYRFCIPSLSHSSSLSSPIFRALSPGTGCLQFSLGASRSTSHSGDVERRSQQ